MARQPLIQHCNGKVENVRVGDGKAFNGFKLIFELNGKTQMLPIGMDVAHVLMDSGTPSEG